MTDEPSRPLHIPTKLGLHFSTSLYPSECKTGQEIFFHWWPFAQQLIKNISIFSMKIRCFGWLDQKSSLLKNDFLQNLKPVSLQKFFYKYHHFKDKIYNWLYMYLHPHKGDNYLLCLSLPVTKKFCHFRDLNPGPSRWEVCTLPIELLILYCLLWRVIILMNAE